jgi:hypothetical protein
LPCIHADALLLLLLLLLLLVVVLVLLLALPAAAGAAAGSPAGLLGRSSSWPAPSCSSCRQAVMLLACRYFSMLRRASTCWGLPGSSGSRQQARSQQKGLKSCM